MRANSSVIRQANHLFADVLAVEHADESRRRIFDAFRNSLTIFEFALGDPAGSFRDILTTVLWVVRHDEPANG